MVREVSGSSPVGGYSGSDNGVLTNPVMAGYLDDLLALGGGQDWSIFKGVLGAGDSTNPEAQTALRAMMNLIGSQEFGTALTNEYNAQKGLPSGQQCTAFLNLYNLIAVTPTTADGKTLLAISQQYISDGGEENPSGTAADQKAVFDVLGTGSTLDSIVESLSSQATDPFTSKMAEIYNTDSPSQGGKAQDGLNQLMADLGLLGKAFQQGNIGKVLTIVWNITNLSGTFPDLTNDPNYQLAMSLLGDQGLNPNSDGSLPDANGHPMVTTGGSQIVDYSLVDIARAYHAGTIQTKDYTALYKDMTTYLGNSMDGKGGQSWIDFFSQTLGNLFH